MTCPKCHHDRELTWKEYLTNHKGSLCSNCGALFRRVSNFFQLSELGVLSGIAITPFVAFLVLVGNWVN